MRKFLDKSDNTYLLIKKWGSGYKWKWVNPNGSHVFNQGWGKISAIPDISHLREVYSFKNYSKLI